MMNSTDSKHLCGNLIAADIGRECLVTVVIPVRNEADHLPPTLESFTRQIEVRTKPLDHKLFEIIIFANNCHDESAAIVRRWKNKHDSLNIHVVEADLPPEDSNIGFVRRLLMNEADARLRRNRHRGGIIMTTDGDTCVAPNWIAANMQEIKNGADAVGGRILISPAEIRQMDGKARRFHLLDTGYRLLAAELEARLDYVSHDYLPRHHQHFNGSFAVTTEAFRRAGGIPEVRCLEDVAFYRSLLRVDAPFRHSPFVRVNTSARHSGRTESGLSTQINEWTMMGQNFDDYFVECAAAIEQRIYLRSFLRDLWKRSGEISGVTNTSVPDINALAGQLFVPELFLRTELENPQTFGAMLENIEREQHRIGGWADNYPLAAIEKTLCDLRRILAVARRETPRDIQCFSQTSKR